jgi:hypothetical protein
VQVEGYDLIVDGESRPMGPRRYLASPQDLSGIEEVPELVRIGIDSFKKEYYRRLERGVDSSRSVRPPVMYASVAAIPNDESYIFANR